MTRLFFWIALGATIIGLAWTVFFGWVTYCLGVQWWYFTLPEVQEQTLRKLDRQ